MCSCGINAPQTYAGAFTVPLPECCVYMNTCLRVLIYVYICVERESGWFLPAAWQSHAQARRPRHHSAGSSLRYVPRRAVLYCPGNDERKLRKLASLDVDCAVLDCEDGVALSKKVRRDTDRQEAHTRSCLIPNDFNSSSLLQTGARS